MSDDLTIEKFKINERLQGVETQIALLTQSIDSLKAAKNDMHEYILKELNENKRVLYGTDTKEGLIIEVNDLWKSQQNRNKHLIIVYTVIAGIVVHAFWRTINTNMEFQEIHNEVSKVQK